MALSVHPRGLKYTYQCLFACRQVCVCRCDCVCRVCVCCEHQVLQLVASLQWPGPVRPSCAPLCFSTDDSLWAQTALQLEGACQPPASELDNTTALLCFHYSPGKKPAVQLSLFFYYVCFKVSFICLLSPLFLYCRAHTGRHSVRVSLSALPQTKDHLPGSLMCHRVGAPRESLLPHGEVFNDDNNEVAWWAPIISQNALFGLGDAGLYVKPPFWQQPSLPARFVITKSLIVSDVF